MAAFDCEIKGQAPFQLLCKSDIFSHGDSGSKIICTSELDSNGLIKFLDEMTSGKHMSLDVHDPDHDYYGFFDEFLGIMETETTGGNSYILDITVNPKKRGEGLGSTLLSGGFAAQSKLATRLSSISGFIRPEEILNIDSWEQLRRFYRKNGFSVDGAEIKARYPNEKLRFPGMMSKSTAKTKILYEGWKRRF